MNELRTFTNHKPGLIIAGVVIVGLILWLLFRPSAVPVETSRVERGEMLVTVDGEGRTHFKDKVTVTAPISGRMARIRLREGDLIPKNYIITRVDPQPPQTRPPSETENDLIPSAWSVYAPISGRVLKVWESNERFVSAGTPIVDIGNAELAEIVVDLLSTDAARIRPGSAVLMQDPAGGGELTARVKTVEPQAFTKVSALGVEEQRVNVVIDKVPPHVIGGDNFRIDIQIIAWQGTNVLKIPSSALFRNEREWSVFVKEGSRAYIRTVRVGHISATSSEILEGLSEGEVVILHPSNQLTDGVRVYEE